jgi:hypothetical protein
MIILTPVVATEFKKFFNKNPCPLKLRRKRKLKSKEYEKWWFNGEEKGRKVI